MEAQSVALTLENPILWPVLCARILHKDAYCLKPQFQCIRENAGYKKADWIIQRKDSVIRGTNCIHDDVVNDFVDVDNNNDIDVVDDDDDDDDDDDGE